VGSTDRVHLNARRPGDRARILGSFRIGESGVKDPNSAFQSKAQERNSNDR
jgi:hypothetical protein